MVKGDILGIKQVKQKRGSKITKLKLLSNSIFGKMGQTEISSRVRILLCVLSAQYIRTLYVQKCVNQSLNNSLLGQDI